MSVTFDILALNFSARCYLKCLDKCHVQNETRSKPSNFNYKWDYFRPILKERKKDISRLFNYLRCKANSVNISLKIYTFILNTVCHF